MDTSAGTAVNLSAEPSTESWGAAHVISCARITVRSRTRGSSVAPACPSRGIRSTAYSRCCALRSRWVYSNTRRGDLPARPSPPSCAICTGWSGAEATHRILYCGAQVAQGEQPIAVDVQVHEQITHVLLRGHRAWPHAASTQMLLRLPTHAARAAPPPPRCSRAAHATASVVRAVRPRPPAALPLQPRCALRARAPPSSLGTAAGSTVWRADRRTHSETSQAARRLQAAGRRFGIGGGGGGRGRGGRRGRGQGERQRSRTAPAAGRFPGDRGDHQHARRARGGESAADDRLPGGALRDGACGRDPNDATPGAIELLSPPELSHGCC